MPSGKRFPISILSRVMRAMPMAVTVWVRLPPKAGGGKSDGATAQTYFNLGCERGSATACRNLGNLLQAGALVPADAAAAQQAFLRADRLSQPMMVTVHSKAPAP